MQDTFDKAVLKLDQLKAPGTIDVVVFEGDTMRKVKKFASEVKGFKVFHHPFHFLYGGRQFSVRFGEDGRIGREIDFMVPLDIL